jgi:TRAP-type C4-dicarboxylate transport system substrate-binding protein
MTLTKNRLAAGVIVLLTAAGVCQPSPAKGPAKAQTQVLLGTLAPPGSTYHKELLGMGQSWQQQGVKLTVYASGMGSEPEIVRRMRINQLQAALLTVGGLAEIDSSVTALQEMPMMFRSLDEAEYVRQQLRADLDKRLLDKGFVVLFWADTGWVRFFTRNAGVHPDDLCKKMKMFVTAGPGGNHQVEIMKAAGCHPVQLEWSDAIGELQTGMIDAVPTSPMVALAGQFNLVTNHMLELNWVPLVGALVITRKAWNGLPEATQEAMRKAAEDTGKQLQSLSRTESVQAVEAMKKRGMQVHVVTPAEEAEWRKMAEGVYPTIRGGIVPADVFDRVQQLLVRYRSARGGQ